MVALPPKLFLHAHTIPPATQATFVFIALVRLGIPFDGSGENIARLRVKYTPMGKKREDKLSFCTICLSLFTS